MSWHFYKSNNILEKSSALESLIVTQAWLKGITAQLQESFEKVPNSFIDAIKESVVSYSTVHHIDHFQSHYESALSYIKNLELSLDDGRDVFVLWLPSENGYCQCAFVCYVVDSDKPVIISPESLPMVV